MCVSAVVKILLSCVSSEVFIRESVWCVSVSYDVYISVCVCVYLCVCVTGPVCVCVSVSHDLYMSVCLCVCVT